MRNVTPGFKDHENITVYGARVIDGVRFMMTSDGYDIMYADADRYFTPADMMGMMSGCQMFEYELTEADLDVRDLSDEECFMMKMYVNAMKDLIDPVWFEAARRL